MNIFSINFDEVYRRHLCRHSSFGNNAMHIIAVLGIYYCLVGIIHNLALAVGVPRPIVVTLALLVPYLGLLSLNVPMLVWLATAITMAAILAAAAFAPLLPWWFGILGVIGFHFFQQWSHRIYPERRDMSEFKTKYVKGPHLFLLLTVYELPILLNYFLTSTKSEMQNEPAQTAQTLNS